MSGLNNFLDIFVKLSVASVKSSRSGSDSGTVKEGSLGQTSSAKVAQSRITASHCKPRHPSKGDEVSATA